MAFPEPLVHRGLVGVANLAEELGVGATDADVHDAVSKLVDENVLAEVAGAGVSQQIFFGAGGRVAPHAAGAPVPVLLVRESADTFLVVLALVRGEPTVIAAGLLPVLLLGQVGGRLGPSHHDHPHLAADHRLAEVRPLGEHVDDDVSGHEQCGVRDLLRGDDRDAERIGMLLIEGVERQVRRQRADVGLDVVLDQRLVGTEGGHNQ